MKRVRHQNKGLRKSCDCLRRTWPKCPHSWHFNFKLRGGQGYRFSLDKHFNKHIDSKSEAEDLAADLRKQIRAGKFGQPASVSDMTLRALAEYYIARAKPDAAPELALIARTKVDGRPLGDWRLADIVTGTVRQFVEVRRPSGIVGTNRNLARLRALFNWGIEEGYVERTPFKRQTQTVIRLEREEARSRRLNADIDEEVKLLAACNPHLRAVVEAALETGMRRGEILSLQWSQIEGMRIDGSDMIWALRAAIVLPWTKTKTRHDRRIPISSRLQSILEMRRCDPAGQPLPADSYVFGNAIGQRVQNFKRAWNTAVLRAHGHEPTYTTTANLTPESRAALGAINLHFHDLRREAGSRWLEGGVPLHTVKDWLGHTNISQTSMYLGTTMKTQHDAMAAFEAHRTHLQRIATDVGTGGRKSLQTATTQDRKPNKTAVGPGPAIM